MEFPADFYLGRRMSSNGLPDDENEHDDADNNTNNNVESLADARDKRARQAWQRRLGKRPKKILTSALVPLRADPAWKGVLRYNAFAHRIEVHKELPWKSPDAPAQGTRPSGPEPRAWGEYDDLMLTEWLQRLNIEIGKKIAEEAVYTVARENTYHPVKDYLGGLQWDGVERLERWTLTYLGADDTPYNREVGKRWLISGVARIWGAGPDCKADCVLILEGEQGLQKSTAFRVLSTPWFLDDLRQFGTKSAAEKIAGRWIIELAELTAMNEVTTEACKSFFGQTMDCFRPAYGRRVIDAPRQCIFAASTNKNVFLKDETGDRRYWPVSCTKIDIERLKRDRDQLWAEAQHLYHSGHVWWLDTPELQAEAEEEQRMRFEADPWEPRVRNYLRTTDEITPEKIAENLLNFEPEEVSKGIRNRISSILRHLNWQRIRSRKKDSLDEYVWIRTGKTKV